MTSNAAVLKTSASVKTGESVYAPVPKLASRIPEDSNVAIANQIVDEFAHKAKVLGIRSISMGELASSLRVSTKTLYKYFTNKDELVYELVVRWEARVHKPITAYGTNNLMEILRYRIKVWVENDAQYSTAFWLDLKTAYPALYKVYIESLHESMRAMRERLGPYLRDDVDVEFAWACYFTLMTDAARRKTFEKVGMTREQCVFAAFDFWVAAALDKNKLAHAEWVQT